MPACSKWVWTFFGRLILHANAENSLFICFRQVAGFESPQTRGLPPLPELELVVTKRLIQPGDLGHPAGLDEKTYKPLTKLHEWSESQQQEVGQFTRRRRGWLLEICN